MLVESAPENPTKSVGARPKVTKPEKEVRRSRKQRYSCSWMQGDFKIGIETPPGWTLALSPLGIEPKASRLRCSTRVKCGSDPSLWLRRTKTAAGVQGAEVFGVGMCLSLGTEKRGREGSRRIVLRVESRETMGCCAGDIRSRSEERHISKSPAPMVGSDAATGRKALGSAGGYKSPPLS